MVRNLRGKLAGLATQPVRPEPVAPPPQELQCRVIAKRHDAPELLRARDLPRSALRRMGFAQAAEAWSGGALFLDTETTGLSTGAGTVAFLIGLGWWEDGAFRTEQLLMRDYAQETHALALLHERLSAFDVVVTFNGRSFDLPLLRTRYTLARMRFPEHADIDLLHASRRAFKPRFTDCSLGALERRLLGIAREHDLPGADVPQRFFDYLDTRDETLLDDVIAHNEQDVLTMALLLARVGDAFERPWEEPHALDRCSLARSLVRVGDVEDAERCYRSALGSVCAPQARRHLSEICRRDGRFEESARLLEAMLRQSPNVDAYVALSKLREHKLKDIDGAQACAQAALALLTGDEPFEVREALLHRIERLARKGGAARMG